jgi:hypothetical protein
MALCVALRVELIAVLDCYFKGFKPFYIRVRGVNTPPAAVLENIIPGWAIHPVPGGDILYVVSPVFHLLSFLWLTVLLEVLPSRVHEQAIRWTCRVHMVTVEPMKSFAHVLHLIVYILALASSCEVVEET